MQLEKQMPTQLLWHELIDIMMVKPLAVTLCFRIMLIPFYEQCPMFLYISNSYSFLFIGLLSYVVMKLYVKYPVVYYHCTVIHA